MNNFINETLEYTGWTKEEAVKKVLLTIASAPILYGLMVLAFLAI